jgi:lactoylglutathione lyase
VSTVAGGGRPRIIGLSHIALFTADVEKSLAFYEGFLGYQEQFRLNGADGSLALTFVKINDLQCIELFPEREPGSDGLYQIAFIVEDARAMRDYLAASGVEAPEVKKGRIGNSNFSVKDPDGHIVEFVQYEPDGWTMQDRGKHMGPRRISGHMRHVGVTVRHLEAAMAFYRDILGCTETWRGSSDDTTLSWVNMKLPDSDDYVELMLYRDPPSRERLGVMNHLCLEVAEMAPAEAELRSRAKGGVYEKPVEHKIGVNRRRLLNILDPDGTRSELMEPRTVDGVPPKPSTAPAP